MKSITLTGPDGKTFEMPWPETDEEWERMRISAQSRLNSPEAMKADQEALKEMRQELMRVACSGVMDDSSLIVPYVADSSSNSREELPPLLQDLLRTDPDD